VYLYDPTPVPRALWRVATRCYEVRQVADAWVFEAAAAAHTPAAAKKAA